MASSFLLSRGTLLGLRCAVVALEVAHDTADQTCAVNALNESPHLSHYFLGNVLSHDDNDEANERGKWQRCYLRLNGADEVVSSVIMIVVSTTKTSKEVES